VIEYNGKEEDYFEQIITHFGFRDKFESLIMFREIVSHENEVRKEQFVRQHFSGFLELVSKFAVYSNRDIIDCLVIVYNIGQVFEEAYLPPAKTLISSRIFNLTKFDLYELLLKYPESISNFFDPRVLKTAYFFKDNARFICRVFLISVLENRKYFDTLLDLQHREIPVEKRARAMRWEISEELQEIEKEVNGIAFEPDQSGQKEKELFVRKSDFIRRYAYVGLTRLAHIFIRFIIGEEKKSPDRDFKDAAFRRSQFIMAHIHDEMSNLSNVLLQTAYSVAEEYIRSLYGTPYHIYDFPADNDYEKIIGNAVKSLNRMTDRLIVTSWTNEVYPGEKNEYLKRIRSLLLRFRDEFDRIQIKETKTRMEQVYSELNEKIFTENLNLREIEVFQDVFRKHAGSQNVRKAFFEFIFGIHAAMKRTRFAIILGGANARQEFPSFDYDGFGAFEKNGITSTGCSNQFYFDRLQDLIREIVSTFGHDYGTAISPFGRHAVSLAELIKYMNSDSDVYIPETDRDMMIPNYIGSYARAHIDLEYGAGNYEFSKNVIEKIHGWILHEKKADVAVGKYMDLKTKSRLAEFEYFRNIKTSEGGLREICNVVWLYKCISGTEINGIARRLLLMGIEKETVRELLESHNYLLNLRIRLDFHYGQNGKFIPSGKELDLFAHSLGYIYSDGKTEGKNLLDDLYFHSNRIADITSSLVMKMVGENPWLKQGITREENRQQRKTEMKQEGLLKISLDTVTQDRSPDEKHAIEKIVEKGSNPFAAEAWSRKDEDGNL
jgi:hypothetical protein